MKETSKDEKNGFVMLEATFCIIICMFVLVLLMSVAFWLYQQVLVTVVTNEVASEVAQNYKLIAVQDNGDVTEEDIAGVGLYRYTLSKKEFDTENEKNATKYMTSRIAQTTLSEIKNAPTISIDTEIDDIGRRHYVVKVSQEYTFLIGNILNVLGMDGTQTIERTAYVQSTDILNYVNTVKTEKYIVDLATGNTKVGKAADSIISAVNSVVQLFRNWGK